MSQAILLPRFLLSNSFSENSFTLYLRNVSDYPLSFRLITELHGIILLYSIVAVIFFILNKLHYFCEPLIEIVPGIKIS